MIKGGFMRGVIFLLTFMFMFPCFAKQYYVYIDKIGVVNAGETAGDTGKGDVVGIYPYTSQYKPTKAERDRYLIKVVDLTENEKNQLLQPLEKTAPVQRIEPVAISKYDKWLAEKKKEYPSITILSTSDDTSTGTRFVTYQYQEKYPIRARKMKIDINKLSTKQEETVDKTAILNNSIVKPLPVFKKLLSN